MPSYVELYFASPDDRSTVVERVSSAIGASFQPSGEPYADYMGKKDGVVFDLKFGHELEDDIGIPFERMPIVLTVRGERGEEDRHEATAKRVFEKLKGDYHPAYVVRALSKVLASRD
jgi:hypothetical protein